MSTTTDLPESATDTFTFTCQCEATVRVVGGVEQPHDCPMTEEQRQAVRDAAAAAEANVEHTDVEPAKDAGDDESQTQMDILQLAEMILVGANNRLAQSKTPPTYEKQIALGQALATLELARWTRAQYALNRQMAGTMLQQAGQQQATAKGPTGIFVPSLAPRR